MTREEFVEGYMTLSGLLPYFFDGEIVSHVGGGGYRQRVLLCDCNEDGCDGWQMVDVIDDDLFWMCNPGLLEDYNAYHAIDY